MAEKKDTNRFSLMGKWWIWLVLFALIALYGLTKILASEKTIPKSPKTLITMEVSGIYEIDINGSTGFYRITKDLTEEWKLNDSIKINQQVVEQYLSQFEKIESNDYVESMEVSKISNINTYSMIIKSADEPIDLKINCYKIDNSDYKYVLQSSQYPNLSFTSNANGLQSQLFWLPERFKQLN